MRAAPRSRARRKADTLALLRTEVGCGVASADEMGNAHLVPLSHDWDGAALVLATPRSSPTATNRLCDRVARVGVGPTRDVVLVDGRVTEGVDDATADAHTEISERTPPGIVRDHQSARSAAATGSVVSPTSTTERPPKSRRAARRLDPTVVSQL